MPHYIFGPRQKNYLLDFQNQRFIGIFMSLRERESKSERERKKEKKQEKEIEKEKRERENQSAGDYISKPPGQNEKSMNYTRKSGILSS
jgi:hypothetical protein